MFVKAPWKTVLDYCCWPVLTFCTRGWPGSEKRKDVGCPENGIYAIPDGTGAGTAGVPGPAEDQVAKVRGYLGQGSIVKKKPYRMCSGVLKAAVTARTAVTAGVAELTVLSGMSVDLWTVVAVNTHADASDHVASR